MKTLLILLLATIPSLSELCAEDSSPLLLSPGCALTGNSLLPGGGELQVAVDGKPLSFEKPEVLFEKHLPEADFISVAWKDGSGQLLHQRDILRVKSGYCVVVDYLYGTGEHAVVRGFAFPESRVELGDQSARSRLPDGQNLMIHALDPASKVEQIAGARKVLFSTTKKAPTPIPTVLIEWSGTTAPKVESVKPVNPMIVKLNVTFPDGQMDELALAWESRPLHLGGKEYKGWAACVRHGSENPGFFQVN